MKERPKGSKQKGGILSVLDMKELTSNYTVEKDHVAMIQNLEIIIEKISLRS
jgi:hypothetical protein